MQEKNELINRTNEEKKLLEDEINKIKNNEQQKIKELNSRISELSQENAKKEEIFKKLIKEKLKQVSEQKKNEEKME